MRERNRGKSAAGLRPCTPVRRALKRRGQRRGGEEAGGIRALGPLTKLQATLVCFSGCLSLHRRRDPTYPAHRRLHPRITAFRFCASRPPEGGSNGGNRRAVSPLAVGEGFQRGPPRNRSPLAAFFLRFLSPLERNRTAGGKETNSIREIHGAYASRRCAAVKSATTKAPLWRFLFPLSFRKRNRAAGGVVGANLTGCASAVAVIAANACVRSIAPPLQIEASASI